MSMVAVSEKGCWIWTGRKDPSGYGVLSINSKEVRAHVYSYSEIALKKITNGILHHKCQNKCCVNPDHLEDLTKRQHADAHIALKSHCLKGHELTPENTWKRSSQAGPGRICKECSREQVKRFRAKRKEVLAS